MDFQKAFDTVPHKRMISKLKSYGIEDHILSWIENYLSDRKQKVIINGTSSEWKDVRDRPFNLKGLWIFVSFRNFLSDNTRVRI
jgi:hypothetical protein